MVFSSVEVLTKYDNGNNCTHSIKRESTLKVILLCDFIHAFQHYGHAWKHC